MRMLILEFNDRTWHDQQEDRNKVFHHDDCFIAYSSAAIILDRLLGIEVRQSVGPLVFGLKLLKCIAQMRISEESNGLFSIELGNRQVDTRELRGLVTGKIQMALQETEFIQGYSAQLNDKVGHATSTGH